MAGDNDRKAEAAAEAEFAAGFSGEETKEPVAPQDGPVASETQENEASEAETTEQPSEATGKATEAQSSQPGKRKFVKIALTELAELRAAKDEVAELRKSHKTLAGTFGTLKQEFAKLQKGEKAEPAAPTSNAEDKSLVDSKPTPGTSTDDIKKILSEQRAQDAMETLSDDYPDWSEIVGQSDKPDPDHPFRKWLSEQPKEYQEKINSTNYAGDIHRAIRKYQKYLKTDRAETEKPSAATESQSAQSPSKTAALKDRIRDAAPIKSAGGTPARTQKTPEQEFAEGFAQG